MKIRTKSKNKKIKKRKPVTLNADKLLRMVSILNKSKEKITYKQKIRELSKIKCKRPLHLQNAHHNSYTDVHPLFPTYISKLMRDCIVRHEWNNLTQLLICFFDAQSLDIIKWQNTLINFIHNPVAQEHKILNEFLQMCLSCRNSNEIQQWVKKVILVQ